MPRKYPDFHTNQFGQQIQCGDKVVFVTSTSRKYEGIEGRQLHMGTVIKMNMNTVRIEFAFDATDPFPQEVEVSPGRWERRVVTRTHLKEANAKPEYCFVVDTVGTPRVR